MKNCWKALSKDKVSIKNTTLARVVFLFISLILKHVQKQSNDKRIDKINEQAAYQRHDKIGFGSRPVTGDNGIHISHGIRRRTHAKTAAGSRITAAS